MKKTLIALMALAGVAMAAVPSTSVITFNTGGEEAGGYVYGVDWGTASYDTHNQWEPSFTTDDNVVLKLTTSKNNVYTTYSSYADPANPTAVWTNQAAVDEMNATLGTSLTLVNIDSAPLAYAGGGGATITLTMNYGNVYTAADPCTMYVLFAGTEGAVSNLTLTGLADGYTMEYATATGTGYVSEATFADTSRITTLVKISGKFADETATVALTTTNAKAGFGMVAYKLVPEPATATLSLLALAGLAARRRRK